jgi:hypothetical protein
MASNPRCRAASSRYPPEAPAGTAASAEVKAFVKRMTGRCLACVAAVMLLAGCAADADNPDQATVPGYRYHDANHTNRPSGNASPQAIYNATHGTWLWPPTSRMDRT